MKRQVKGARNGSHRKILRQASARWNFDPSITYASADGNSITFMLDDDSSETIPFYYDSGDWSSGSAESEAVDEAVGYILGCLR